MIPDRGARPPSQEVPRPAVKFAPANATVPAGLRFRYNSDILRYPFL
jgi:hypothetical protein